MADPLLQQKRCPHFRITVRSPCPPAPVGCLTRNISQQNNFILEEQNLSPRCLFCEAWYHLHSVQLCSAQVLYLNSEQGMLFPTPQWLPWHTWGWKDCSTSAVDLGNSLLGYGTCKIRGFFSQNQGWSSLVGTWHPARVNLLLLFNNHFLTLIFTLQYFQHVNLTGALLRDKKTAWGCNDLSGWSRNRQN